VSELDALLDELATALRGPRQARERLVAEVEAHLREAHAAERAAGRDDEQAARAVAARFGDVRQTAAEWNRHQAKRRSAARRNALVVAVAAVAAGALGITQYASGKPRPTPPPCTAQHAACLEQP
jgi:hypothetical protein